MRNQKSPNDMARKKTTTGTTMMGISLVDLDVVCGFVVALWLAVAEDPLLVPVAEDRADVREAS